jgi:hypothetical protein
MAQDIFEQLHAAVKQAESQGKRFDEKGNLLTSPKGAQGEMQVMPKTARDPGYGVTPAQGKHPDELARVGKDYLKAMVDKYGDTQKALIAYNWGPKNTDDWLAKGADPKILPAETKNYVGKISKALGSDKVAPLPDSGPTASEKMMTDALRSGMSAENLVKDAGPGYKAAMAMMFLADDKPETSEDDIWKEAETPVEEPDATPNALASLDLGYQSPFPAAQPVQPQHLAEGGMPFSPTVAVKGTAREELDKIKADYDAYNEQVNKFNDIQNAYKTQVDAYNKSATDYNNSFLRDNGKMILANVSSTGKSIPVPTFKYYTADDAGNLTAYTPAADLLKNAVFSAVPNTPDYSFLRTSDLAAPGAVPTAPTATAPTAPAVTQEQYQAKADAAKKDAGLRQTAVNVAFDPASYGLSMNKLFSHGGVVHRADGSPEYGEIPTGGITEDTRTAMARPITARGALDALKEVGMDVGRGALSNAESLVRGAVSQVPGTFGDLEKGGRQLLNWSFGPGGVKVSEQTYAPTSEEIRASVPRMTPARQESAGMESLGEVMAPGLGKGTGRAASMLEDMTVGNMQRERIRRAGAKAENIPDTAYDPLRERLEAQGSLAYAVKPTGGAYMAQHMDSNMGDYVKNLEKEAAKIAPDRPDLAEFLRNKTLPYLTKNYGTTNDPVREAILNGQMGLSQFDAKYLPEGLVLAAARGDKKAREALETTHDVRTGLRGHVYDLSPNAPYIPSDVLRQQERLKMLEQGYTGATTPKLYFMGETEAKSAARDPRMDDYYFGQLGVSPSYNGTPEGLKYSLANKQPVYDLGQSDHSGLDYMIPENVVSALSSVDPKKLKNSSFADALIQGNNNIHSGLYKPHMKEADKWYKAVDEGDKEVAMKYPKEASLFGMSDPVVTDAKGFTWRKVIDPDATRIQSQLMNHSIEGYAYPKPYRYSGAEKLGSNNARVSLLNGDVELYSLYDKNGHVVSNLEYLPKQREIFQARGNGVLTGNDEPVNYADQVFDLVEHLDPTEISNSVKTLLRANNKFAKGGAVERISGDNRRYL